jgi:hypothetical protein
MVDVEKEERVIDYILGAFCDRSLVFVLDAWDKFSCDE